MKGWALILTAVAGAAILVPMAFSASSRDPLAARVAALEKKVKALQKDEQQLKAASDGGLLVSACDIAITADAFQGTWQTIDQLSLATHTAKTYFGAQSPIDDTVAGQPACLRVGVTRSQDVPPTTALFDTLLSSLPEAARARP
jgi:outer membrane murein-binding lipoprotein Lpp